MNAGTTAAEAYPLCWPENRPRTTSRASAVFHSRHVQTSEFGGTWKRKVKLTLADARDDLLGELRMLGATGIVISTNIPLRQDGLPYSGRRAPDDPGAAIYFTRGKRQLCFACDRWDRVEDNIYAVAKTIDALRGIARWGTGDMIEAAFKGFAALPAAKPWHEVLGVPATATNDEIEEAYRREARRRHPDCGGSNEAFHELTAAMGQVRGRLSGHSSP